jgi:hypothetical protein
MTAAPARIVAVVLPARGGAHLARALAALEWADERAVLALDAATIDLPPGVASIADPSRLETASAGWVLVLAEEERLDPAGGDALRAALATAAGDEVFALRCITTVLDMRIRLGGTVTRLAPRRTPLVVRPGLDVEFARGAHPVRALDVAIVRSRGTTLTDAVELLAAEATTLASLVDRSVGQGRGILWHPLVAGGRAVTARGQGRLGLGRWVFAVLEGYRVVVTYAKLWERRRERVVEALG